MKKLFALVAAAFGAGAFAQAPAAPAPAAAPVAAEQTAKPAKRATHHKHASKKTQKSATPAA